MTGPRPRWKRLEPRLRRAEILQAARAAFADRPYDEVSLTMVADGAAVSRTLVTHYFPGGKRELFLAVQHQVLELGRSAIRSDLGLPIEETVERNVSAWLDFAATHRHIALSLDSVVTPTRDPQAAALVAETRDRLVDTLLANHFGTTDVPDAIRLVLRSYTGLAQVAVGEWLRHGRATRAEVHTLMVRGLLTLVREVAPAVAAAGTGAERFPA